MQSSLSAYHTHKATQVPQRATAVPAILTFTLTLPLSQFSCTHTHTYTQYTQYIHIFDLKVNRTRQQRDELFGKRKGGRGSGEGCRVMRVDMTKVHWHVYMETS